MVKVFHDRDGDLHVLSEETVTLIGFGIQGRVQAHNLRDSGVSVIIGNRDDEFRQRAIADGFQTYDIADAAQPGDISLWLANSQLCRKHLEGIRVPVIRPEPVSREGSPRH